MFFKYLIAASILSVLVVGVASSDPQPPGIMEGHLKIVSLKEVELSDGDGSKTVAAEIYAVYPLVILSRIEKKEIAQVAADGNGNYRVALSPGDYMLDVQGRATRHVRARPQPFTVVSNQTVRVDIDIDTGIR